MQPPNVNLTPGQRGPQVKQLQDWLVANGYMTQSQENTGPGIYGPQTKAAVLKVQQALGVDNSTGPGYWGPHTMAAVSAASNPQPDPQPQEPTAPPAPQGIPYDPSLAQRGVTQDVWNGMNSTQQAIVGAVASIGKSQYATTGNAYTLQDGLKAATSDPTIIAKYADALNLDKLAFTQNIAQLSTAFSTTSQNQQTQFENERKALAEQEAAAGAAYSGFRNKAEQDLKQTESGIITSTRSQLQSNLDQATAAFAAKYGSAATPLASVGGMSGTIPSNITGSLATPSPSNPLGGAAYQADVQTFADNFVKTSATNPVVPVHA